MFMQTDVDRKLGYYADTFHIPPPLNHGNVYLKRDVNQSPGRRVQWLQVSFQTAAILGVNKV